MESVSSALQGRVLTTGPPGKSHNHVYILDCYVSEGTSKLLL